MYSYGPPHMAVQKQDDQHEHTFSSYVRIRDVVLKTYLGQWTIGRSGERGSGISVLPARYDDDDYFSHRYGYGYLFQYERNWAMVHWLAWMSISAKLPPCNNGWKSLNQKCDWCHHNIMKDIFFSFLKSLPVVVVLGREFLSVLWFFIIAYAVACANGLTHLKSVTGRILPIATEHESRDHL